MHDKKCVDSSTFTTSHLHFFNAMTLLTSVVCFATRLGICQRLLWCMLGPLPHKWITWVLAWRLFGTLHPKWVADWHAGAELQSCFSYLDFVICPMVPNILADCCHPYLQQKSWGQVGLNFLSRGDRCFDRFLDACFRVVVILIQ